MSIVYSGVADADMFGVRIRMILFKMDADLALDPGWI
jgi:hypothetical protein